MARLIDDQWRNSRRVAQTPSTDKDLVDVDGVVCLASTDNSSSCVWGLLRQVAPIDVTRAVLISACFDLFLIPSMRTPLVPVGHLDLSQTDKSLNPAILNLWPSGTILEVKTWRDGNGGERAHLADRLLALHCAATSLSVLCFRSFHLHRDLRRVEPFSNMEARLDRYRRRADSL